MTSTKLGSRQDSEVRERIDRETAQLCQVARSCVWAKEIGDSHGFLASDTSGVRGRQIRIEIHEDVALLR